MADGQFTDSKRTVLFGSDAFEVVTIEWPNQRDHSLHNHGWSLCSILIQNGLFQNTMNFGGKTETQILEEGQILTTPIGALHELKCLSATGKTLHVYSPKIKELSEVGLFSFTINQEFKENLKLAEPCTYNELKNIIEKVKDHSVSAHSPFFMNQLFSGISPQMLLAEDLINQSKTTLATHEASPAFSAIEAEVVERLGELIGWPIKSREGVVVPGGSAANFMAIHCARQKYDATIKRKGLTGQSFKVYVSSEAHYSFKKAAAVLGIGTENIVAVPCNDNGQMNSIELENLVQQHKEISSVPLLVCATAGTTVLGAFDNIDALSLVCKKYDIWLHVDGAWGGPALFSKNHRYLVSGIEKADSATFDAHKLFGASMTCTLFLTKHVGALIEANDVSGADYLFHSDDPNADRGKLSWQCGRGADAVSFWTIWKSFGTDGLGKLVDNLVSIRLEAQEWINKHSRLQLISDPKYLNLCVRIKPPESALTADPKEWSKFVRESLKINQLALVNYSTDENGTFLRLILAHPQLKIDHIKKILEWSLDVK